MKYKVGDKLTIELIPEIIKLIADGYFAGKDDWVSSEQEADTKAGWCTGFNYAIKQFTKTE